jgi:anti-sigma-K factor RskA
VSEGKRTAERQRAPAGSPAAGVSPGDGEHPGELPGEHPEDLLPGYVLDALEPAEAQAVAGHLAGCFRCAAEVKRLRQVVELLPLSAAPVAPPRGSREAILARVHRDRQAGRRSTLLTLPPAPPAPAAPRPIAAWLDWAPWAAAVVAIASATVFAWQSGLARHEAQTLRAENATLAATASELAQALAALDPASSRLVSLQGADAAPSAAGVVVYDPHGRTAVVMLDRLPPLPPGQVYQLWLLRTDSAPASAGTMAPDAAGTTGAVVQALADLGDFDGYAVTLEPAPGRPAPTGPFVARSAF